MQITTRPFQDTDLGRCLEIERAAVRSNHYLNDVIDYYRTTKGEFTLALADNFPAGMGKLTVLYDGSAWLELLRVHPDFQRQGMGKAIYRRYLEQVAAFGCPAARMYTGVKNVASAALAEQFGLHRGPEFRGMSLPVQDDSFQPQPNPLHLLGGEEAAEYLLPLQEKTGGFLSINHTFYKLNRSTCFGFAAAGWVYGDGEGSVLVCGARFQPQKALYIAALAAPNEAKKENALSFARNLAAMTDTEKLTVHFPNQDQQEQEFYQAHGFTVDPSDDVVYER